ncbi:hypothetical protein D3C85_1443570 [compost metagenome]
MSNEKVTDILEAVLKRLEASYEAGELVELQVGDPMQVRAYAAGVPTVDIKWMCRTWDGLPSDIVRDLVIYHALENAANHPAGLSRATTLYALCELLRPLEGLSYLACMVALSPLSDAPIRPCLTLVKPPKDEM